MLDLVCDPAHYGMKLYGFYYAASSTHFSVHEYFHLYIRVITELFQDSPGFKLQRYVSAIKIIL